MTHSVRKNIHQGYPRPLIFSRAGNCFFLQRWWMAASLIEHGWREGDVDMGLDPGNFISNLPNNNKSTRELSLFSNSRLKFNRSTGRGNSNTVRQWLKTTTDFNPNKSTSPRFEGIQAAPPWLGHFLPEKGSGAAVLNHPGRDGQCRAKPY